jgi:Ni,Fe-hydrogenase III small subunit/formate hydrogenlyase subunit 6/NADH:ubiquinone oxidoreductase subunit I
MFKTLQQSLKTGVVTSRYPDAPAEVSLRARGRPEVDWARWGDARPAAAVCPTGAIEIRDEPDGAAGQRAVTLDLGKCVFCGLCAEVDPAIRMTPRCELAATSAAGLRETARYQLKPDGSHDQLLPRDPAAVGDPVAAAGSRLQSGIQASLGRSLHIRQVDAGSCNGCEIEIQNLNSPVYDLERFGIHFVASPRHADLLLVTGPVTRNMEQALRKTYAATPDPRLVVAVGACGCTGGIFGRNYATCGAVDAVIPVDVYIPGCPPNPYALLHGLLLAIGRLNDRTKPI